MTELSLNVGNGSVEIDKDLIIVNGLPQTVIEALLIKYKAEKENKGSDVYSKVWWLGSNDLMVTPDSVDITS